MISSTSNSKVKRLVALNQKAKLRRKEGVFLAEGEKMFAEAPRKWLREIYVSETFMRKCEERGDVAVQNAVSSLRSEILTDEVFEKVSDTQTPQGILCVLSMPQYALEQYLQLWQAKDAPLLLLVEDLQDPGNLGTMFRAGEGANVSGIIMTEQTVDLFNPKTIRSTMGSIYRVPFFVTENLSRVTEQLRACGIAVYAAHLDDSDDYAVLDYRQPSAFLIGNESAGLRQETAKMATQYIKIPMTGQVESLNAAVAASVLLYEAARQRRIGK